MIHEYMKVLLYRREGNQNKGKVGSLEVTQRKIWDAIQKRKGN